MLSVAASAGAGIMGVRAALALEDARSTPIVAMLGWALFLGLGQLGWGRPAYALLRQAWIHRQLDGELLDRILGMTLRQAVGACLVFVALCMVMASFQGLREGLLSFGLLTMGVAALGAAAFWRDSAYALSHEPDYEQLELLRRLSLLVALTLLGQNVSPALLGALCLAVAVTTTARIARKLRGTLESLTPVEAANAATEQRRPPANAVLHAVPAIATGDRLNRLRPDARRYLAFSVSELCLYNAPLVVYTVANRSQGIVDFAIWTKLFMFVVLPMRIVSDARLNLVTRLHFEGDGPGTGQALRRSALLALAVVAGTCLAIYLTTPWLVALMAPGREWSSPWLPLSIAAWGALNAVQHVFGSYTVSHGKGHAFAWTASLATSIAVLGTVALGSAWDLSLGLVLCLAAVPYAVSAAAFCRHAWQALPPPRVPVHGH